MTSFLERVSKGDKEGFDLLILSCAREQDALYWQELLTLAKGSLIPDHTEVITLTEKWEGGAGNALGTLHAVDEAEATAKKNNTRSPSSILREGGSVALYHTAGKGTRMAPLTLAEGGMKAAIKIPAFLPKKKGPLSILEMVIRQTAPLAKLSNGRLSVFWTDQLFLPSTISWSIPTSPVEVYAIDLPHLSKEAFIKRNLSTYGLWQGERYVDKLSLSNFEKLTQDKPFKGAINLGSFSIAHAFLAELMEIYRPELNLRKGKLDTDPDWWMVATLPEELYLELKGKTPNYDRFKPVKVVPRVLGADTDWWDFGTVDSYRKQLFKLLSKEEEGTRLRNLFGIDPSAFNGDSLLLHSDAQNCSVKASILASVEAKDCYFDHALAIDTQLEGGVISHALLYGCLHKKQHAIH